MNTYVRRALHDQPRRCPDCSRLFPDASAAFLHVMAEGPAERGEVAARTPRPDRRRSA